MNKLSSINRLPLQKNNDAEVNNIGEYLSKLLCQLIDEEEGFDSKRPFGNSGWLYELFRPLIDFNFIEGNIYEGTIEECDEDNGKRILKELIKLKLEN